MPQNVAKPVVLVTTHFMEDDPTFISDYAEITICIDGQLVKTYGDAYHEKGRDRAQGYLDGLTQAWGADGFDHQTREVADYV